ncbi:armadillo-type protein [Gaertneriomyces semiglobifer]|nr:armadillo-type protein [Gaertneriomyces semiglobifer]
MTDEASKRHRIDLLLKRATVLSSQRKNDEALKDIREALMLDQKDPRTVEAMRGLLQQSAKEASSAAASLETLLATATRDNTSGNSADMARQSFEAAQRLMLATTQTPEATRHLADAGAVNLLVHALLRERRASGEVGAPSLQAALLQIIANFVRVPANGSLLLSCVARTDPNLFIGRTDAVAVSMAIDALSRAMLSLPESESTDYHADAITIVKAMVSLTDAAHPATIRMSALTGVIKCIVTADIAMALVNSGASVAIFNLIDDTDEKLAALVPAALARVFERLTSEDEKAVAKACSAYVRNRTDSDSAKTKRQGFLALAAIIQASSSIGSGILLSNGFLENAIDCIEFESREVQLAMIELLSSACTDKPCRSAIAKLGTGFLNKMSQSTDMALKSAASVTLTKLMASNSMEGLVNSDPQRMVVTFMNAAVDQKTDATSRLRAVEGLAYLSMQGHAKERIVAHQDFLKHLISLAKLDDRSLQFGVANIICNVTLYRKPQTQEEQQVRKLREMAKDIPAEKDDPLDNDDMVEKRCKLVVQAGAIGVAVLLAKSDSPRVRDTVAQILLNIATNRQLHGTIVQQGGARALVDLTQKGTPEGIATAAQALAKVAITVNPNIAFKGQRAVELVRPLVDLCDSENQLRQFEALMALTNLASMNDDIRSRIVQVNGVKKMEFLQLSDNELIQRAATEALCNMMFDPVVFTSYAQASSSSKLRIFIALSDAEDFGTRRAAAGALAILSSSENACRLVMQESRAVEVIVGMVAESEQSPEMQHRGVECLRNIANVSDEFAKTLASAGAVKHLGRLAEAKDPAISGGAATALAAFRQQNISIA